MTRYRYQAFGIIFDSDFEIPELPVAKAGPVDVRIEIARIPAGTPAVIERGVVYRAGQGWFLLEMEGVARYLVSCGEVITVEPDGGAHYDDIRVFLLGSCLGALLHQRGVLAMHASAVNIDGGAVLFAGPSGAGKSTLAAALHQRGYNVLSDDVTAVTLEATGPWAHPGVNRMKLWRDSVLQLGHDPQRLNQVRPATRHRFVYPLIARQQQPIPWRAIFVLIPWNQSGFEFVEVAGPARFALLLEHTYQSRFLTGLKARQAHFAIASKSCATVPMRIAQRPDKDFRVEDLATEILSHLG